MNTSQIFIMVLCTSFVTIYSIVFIKILKVYFAPSLFFVYFWSFLIFISISFDTADSYNGLFYIFISILAFCIGELILLKKRKKYKVGVLKKSIEIETLMKFIVCFLFFILIIIFLDYAKSNISLKNLFDLDKLLEINANEALERYSGGATVLQKMLNQIKAMLVYSSASLSGVLCALTKKKKERIISFLIFVPVIIDTLYTNAKLGLVVTTILFVISNFAINIYYGKTNIESSFKKFPKIFLAISIILSLLFLSMLLRAGRFDAIMVDHIKLKFVNYASGSLYAFNDWFETRWIDQSVLGFGTNTFAGILNVLGIITKKQGIYDTVFYSGIWNTNVYTMFKGLILDFGSSCTVLIFLLLGCFSGYIYKELENNRNIKFFIIAIYIYLFIIYGFVVSPFAYSSLTLFPLIVWIVLKVSYRKYRIKIRGGA